MAKSTTPSAEVAETEEVFSAELMHANKSRLSVDFADIKSSDDAMRALLAEFGEIVDVSEFGDGFIPVEKGDLCGNRLIILDTTFVEKNVMEGKTGDYVVVRAFDVPGNRKVVFADGSTGIFVQLKSIVSKTGRRGGFGVPNGLRRSDYVYTDDKGEQSKATTFYLDESPAA